MKTVPRYIANKVIAIRKSQLQTKWLISQIEDHYPELRTKEDNENNWLWSQWVDLQGSVPEATRYLCWLQEYLTADNPHIANK